MRHPLPGVVIAYVLGIAAGAWLAAPLWLLFSIALLLAIACFTTRKNSGVLLILLLFFCGWTNLAWRTQILSPNDLRNLAGPEPTLAAVRGVISEPPVERLSRPGEEDEFWSTRLRVEASALRLGKDWLAAHGTILVTLPGRLPEDYYRGRRIEVNGVLQRPPVALIQGLFDYRQYLYWQGIYYQLVTDGPEDFTLIDGQSFHPPLDRRFQRWARAAMVRGLPEADQAVRLLYAMTLGWKTTLNGEVAEPFMRSGTMHIFAISGLHVALIAAILVQLFRMFNVPRSGCGLIVIPVLWGYAAATGWQPSATRATVMMSVIIAGWALKRPSHLLNSVCAAGFLILLYDPRELFHAGFQLSFAVVISIVSLVPLYDFRRNRPFAQDPLLPPELRPRWQWILGNLLARDPLLPPELRPRWQRVLDLPIRFVSTSFATSLAAWLGSMPVVAYYFNLATPISLLANLVVVPLSAFAIMSVIGSWLTAFWLPGVSVLFNHGAWFWMTGMMRFSEWFAAVPGGWFHVASPGWFVFLIYYLILAGWFSGWILASWKHFGLVISFCAGVTIVALVAEAARTDVEITILPARGGEVIYVDEAWKTNDLMIDCGSEFAAQRITKPFLRSRGVNRLPALFMSHGDADHVGGVPYLMDNFRISRVVTSEASFRSPYYREVVEQLRETPERWRALQPGEQYARWTLLHPPKASGLSRADDKAMVLFREIHGVKILLLSELGRLGQRMLAERHPDLKADIIVTGLPNDDEPVKDYLLSMLEPKLLIVRTSRRDLSEYGGRELRERLDSHSFPVFYTSDVGGVTLRVEDGAAILKNDEGVLWKFSQRPSE